MRNSGCKKTYEALDMFRTRSLLDLKSAFMADDNPLVDAVWTPASARELTECFIESPDESKRNFFDKLRDQLQGASPGAMQLLVELMWLHLVISDAYREDTKRTIIAQTAAIGDSVAPMEIFDEALGHGIAATGTSFFTRRPNQLCLLIRFVVQWVELSLTEREALLEDPWSFRRLVFGLEGIADQTQRHALIHLVHPDAFEDIVSQYHKRDIVAVFGGSREFDNVDVGLVTAREQMLTEFGNQASFYDDAVRSNWDATFSNKAAVESSPEPQTELAEDRQAWLLRGSSGERVPEWLDRGIGAVYFSDSALKITLATDVHAAVSHVLPDGTQEPRWLLEATTDLIC